MQEGHMYGYKGQRTCVLLGIGEQERETQKVQPGVVNVIKVRRQKDICMGKSRKDMCPFSYWSVCQCHQSSETKGHMYGQKPKRRVLSAIGEQERKIQNAQVNFIKVRRQKKVIRRSVQTDKNEELHFAS